MSFAVIIGIVVVVFAALLMVLFLPSLVGSVDTSNIANNTEALETLHNISSVSGTVFSILPFIILAVVAFGVVVAFLMVRR